LRSTARGDVEVSVERKVQVVFRQPLADRCSSIDLPRKLGREHPRTRPRGPVHIALSCPDDDDACIPVEPTSDLGFVVRPKKAGNEPPRTRLHRKVELRLNSSRAVAVRAEKEDRPGFTLDLCALA